MIFNPAARSHHAGRQRARLAALPGRPVVRATRGPGEAQEQALRAVAQGFRTVVAAGGDGTVNEVVNGLRQARVAADEVTLGLLPIGTMNVFAAELGIPCHAPRRAWQIVLAGHVRRVDRARANDHGFVQLAGIGFDAEAVAGVDGELKKNFGPLSYVISAAKVAARRPPPRLLVRSDHDGGLPREGSFVLVGNGRFYGGPVAVFKRAVVDDGRLDVLIFRHLGYLDLVRYLQGILFGTHLQLPDVDYFQTSRLEVRGTDPGRHVPFEVDGELAGCAPVTLSVEPGGLRVLAPPLRRAPGASARPPAAEPAGSTR